MITTNYGYNRESLAELGRLLGPSYPTRYLLVKIEHVSYSDKISYQSLTLGQIWISNKTSLSRLNLHNTSTLKKYLKSYGTWQFKPANLFKVKTRF